MRYCVRSRPAALALSFFFNDTATTEIYTLSLHDALPISNPAQERPSRASSANSCDCAVATKMRRRQTAPAGADSSSQVEDRKSTRLNSSHGYISYAVFCLKKKKKQQ